MKVGGTLVYSTCTIGAEENQYNLKWFLDNYPFKLESIDPYLPEELQGKTTRAGYLSSCRKPFMRATAFSWPD